MTVCECQSQSGLLTYFNTPLGITQFRFHRQLEASLSAANVSQRTDALSFVLLGILDAVKTDAKYTATQIAY